MKVSVITAVYNGHDTIADTIESVSAQDHPEIEHVVIDGASNDGTREVLVRYRGSIDVLVSEPDAGIYDALNKGIARATGEVIGFLHAGDLFADPDVLKRIAEAFADTAVEAVYGDLVYVRKDAPDRVVRYWKSGDFSSSKLRRGWMPPHPTFYVRRSVYQRLGGFDTSFRIAADYDCMLRFLFKGGIVPVYIPRVLVKMRVGGASNRSLSNVLQKSREDYRALSRHGAGGLRALVWKNLSKVSQFTQRS